MGDRTRMDQAVHTMCQDYAVETVSVVSDGPLKAAGKRLLSREKPSVGTAGAEEKAALTAMHAQRYLSKHLVFGKAVRLRHYPVTVNAKRSALRWKPLDPRAREGCQISLRRKSGDRPDTSLGLFNFDGRVEEHGYRILHSRVARQPPKDYFPLWFGAFESLNAGE
jgi:hypothetical protein